MEAPEDLHVPERLPRPQRSWVDVAFSVSAMMVSLISLFAAFQHGQAMERLVETNARQASASVWPALEMSSTINSGGENSDFSVGVTNNGVGPARIHSFQVFVDGHVVANLDEFASACCGGDRSDVALQTSSNVAGRILPAGQAVTAFRIGVDPRGGMSRYEALRDAWLGDRVHSEVCYCSVFEECWIATSSEAAGQPVPGCSADAQSFEGLLN